MAYPAPSYPQVRAPRKWYKAETDPLIGQISKLEEQVYWLHWDMDFIAQHGEGGIFPVGTYEAREKEVVEATTELAWLARQAGVLEEFNSPIYAES